jgi:membrane-bound lytic murein transglycosylase A
MRAFAAKSILHSLSLIMLAGCATTPEPVAVVKCPACEVCQVCQAPLPIAAPDESGPDPMEPAIPAADVPRGRLERAQWPMLTAWGSDNPTEALSAFLQSCIVLSAKAEWLDSCNRASVLAAKPRADLITQFFRDNFDPWRAVNADASDTGIVTGYYEPLLRGSRTPNKKYPYPVFAAPQDLVTVDLSDVYPDLKFRRLRGRLVGNKLVPYLERGEIESATNPLKGLEIAYVDDAVELFFLQIQGSGQIQLPDGSRLRVGYADQNGHPFRSLGGLLVRRGELKLERASMQGIKEWARRNPARIQRFMNHNPSYVFFKELPNDLSGPIGTLGVPLTAERSIAVDQRVIPLGAPVYLATTYPGSKRELNRLMVAQDTGGAINGGVRADFYWGFGDNAGAEAGKMKQTGRMWVLLPKGYDPNSVLNIPAPATPAPAANAQKRPATSAQ